jgi:hypothetical protein
MILKTNRNYLIFVVVLLILVLGRIVPHPPNVTPLIGLMVFSSQLLKGISFLLVPVIAMFLSDLIVNNYIYAGYFTDFVILTPGFIWIYSPIILFAFLTKAKLFQTVNFPKVVGLSLSGSTIFFLVSNFGVWVSSGIYALNFQGLLHCYTLAIPFYGNSIIGDLCFSISLYVAYKLSTEISETSLKKI